MKFRFILAFFSLFLSLGTAADRKSISCSECWAGASTAPTIDQMFGVNIHFIDARPGEVKMIADAGFRWVRMDFKWDLTEHERGQYDFSSYDRLMNELDAYGIHPLFILDYGNPLYNDGGAPRTADARQAFARWAVTAADHFANRGAIWEVYNEPNHPMFWRRSNATDYAALALTVARSFRAAGVNEKLIGPATSGIDFSFLEACLASGVVDSWSAISVHPYREANPENVAGEYARLREMIANHRSADGSERVREIISSEWGYSSARRNVNEDMQAALLAREFLTNAANGIALSIWYDWRDDGVDTNDPDHHFGLVRNAFQMNSTQPYRPKPAYLAARTLIDQFAGNRFERRVEAGSDEDYVLMFVKGNERRIAAWSTSANTHRVTVAEAAGLYSVTKLTGERGGTIQANNGLSIELSRAPIYLTRLR